MIGRIIEVASDGVYLAVKRGFMIVSRDGTQVGKIALDDIAALVINCHGATWSANLTVRLSERGAPIVVCGHNHVPIALVWPIDGHHEQGRRMQAQAEATLPMRKRLWQTLVRAKIVAQADALDVFGVHSASVRRLIKKVRSGDPDNVESMAARRYWPLMMGREFRRDRSADGINSMLNYGYTILRSATARSIVAAGLHPSLAIHHQSRGTALRLADDLMEPFRPLVDGFVKRVAAKLGDSLDRDAKAALAKVTTLDLQGPKGASPLQTCLDRLATSLAQVYMKNRPDLELPSPPLALFRNVF